MIRTSPLLLCAAVLALTGCKRAERQPEPAATAEAAPAPAAAAPLPGQIDPEPVKAAASAVVAREDITVDDRPACALTVRYAGRVDQPVTWQGEHCADLDIRFVSAADIAKIGQEAKMSAETRDDIAALPQARTLYVEGRAASAIYPANAMDRIYKVPLAD